MTFLSWRNDYAVNFPLVDSEHRNLFDLINEFHDSCESGDSRSESSCVLSRLVAYAEEHFQHEEAMMEINGYPRLDHHREQHAVLFASIFDLNKKFAANSANLDLRTRSFLKHWLLDHILAEDMDFRDFRLREVRRLEKAADDETRKQTAEEVPPGNEYPAVPKASKDASQPGSSRNAD